jgi:tetratricopeptide (TPR) repeat protein
VFSNAPQRPGAGPEANPLDEAFQQLQQAENLRARGELDRARILCEPLVNRFPDYYGALHTLGLIYVDKRLYPQALGCLVRAAMLDPRSWKTLIALSGVYLELGATEMAARTLEQARQLKTDDTSVHLALAEIFRNEREYELARDSYRKAFELDRNLHASGVGLANCLMDLGEYGQAAEVLTELTKRGVRSLPVVSLLNQLPPNLVDIDVISAIAKVTPEPGADKEDFENSLAFIRAAALDRAGKHKEAWDELIRANARIWPNAETQARELAVTQRANIAELRDKQIKIRSGKGFETQTISLFILGPSRSGKTTMEALVGSLENVKRGHESPAMENAVRRTFQSAGLLTHRMFDVLPPRLDGRCSELYSEELERRASTAKVFTNTHPGRIHDAARVAAAIPNVRFIFVKRDLDDSLLRIFMQKYALGNADSYNLRSIRDSLIWYHQMIDLLNEKMPKISQIVRYEDMIAEPSATLRLAANLCGLPMNEGQLPTLGDDRGCAIPYRDMIANAI